MPYSTVLLAALASLVAGEAQAEIREQVLADVGEILETILRFRAQAVTASSTTWFEKELTDKLRELGRRILERTLNDLEPAVEQLPSSVRWEALVSSLLRPSLRVVPTPSLSRLLHSRDNRVTCSPFANS